MLVSEPWEFGTLGIYDFRSEGPYRSVFQFLSDTKSNLKGNILEAGTFRGRMSLALSLWLRQEGIESTIHTFDTFSGFPSYSEQDSFEKFWELRDKGLISNSHFERIEKLKSMKNALGNERPHPSNLSSSNDFSDSQLVALEKKMELLQISNLRIHIGSFEKTMRVDEIKQNNWWLVFIDCDLYEGYTETLLATWENVVEGGMVFLDEYYSLKFPGAFIAVEEFRQNVRNARLVMVDSTPSFPRWALLKVRPYET